MLFDVGMVRRGLKRDVERDLDAYFARSCQQVTEILERAELRVNCLVPAVAVADRPGAARIARLRLRAVVGALALSGPDRVDRRQIQHVEPHADHVGEQLLDVRESTVLLGIAGGRTRKHLVPR